MGLDLDYTNGNTPLDEDEKEGLLIKSITTHGELNEFEQQNIEKAILWLKRKKLTAEEIISEKFIRELHAACMQTYGNGRGNFARQTRTLVLINTRSPWPYHKCLAMVCIG